MPRRFVRALPAALLFLALAPLLGARGVTLAPWAAGTVAAVLALLATAALLRGVRVPPEAAFLAALVGWGIVVAAVRAVAVGHAAWLVASGVVAVVILVVGQRPRARSWAAFGVLAAGVATAVWLLVDRLQGQVRPGAALEQSVLSATIVVLALAVLPLLRAPGLIRLLAGALLLAGLLAAESRGALLAALALALLWGLRAGSPRLRRVAVAVVAIAAVGLGWRLWRDRDPLRWERLRIWQVALQTARAEAPLGAGPGGYADAALAHNFPRAGEFARFHREPSLAESDLLQLAASLGVVGVLLGAGLAAVLVRRSGPDGWGVLTVLAVTSAFNTQLPVPAVAWTAALAVAASVRRPPPRWRLRAAFPLAASAAVALAAALGLALSWPRPGLGRDPAQLLSRAVAEAREGADRTQLADAEALAMRATAARPHWAEAWAVLGAIRLDRGLGTRDASLIAAARRAYGRARRENPNNPFAAMGAARCADALGDPKAALAFVRTALAVEPHFVRAWLQLGVLELEGGRVDGACQALGGAEAALDEASRAVFVSDYERALAADAPALRATLRRACGAVP